MAMLHNTDWKMAQTLARRSRRQPSFPADAARSAFKITATSIAS